MRDLGWWRRQVAEPRAAVPVMTVAAVGVFFASAAAARAVMGEHRAPVVMVTVTRHAAGSSPQPSRRMLGGPLPAPGLAHPAPAGATAGFPRPRGGEAGSVAPAPAGPSRTPAPPPPTHTSPPPRPTTPPPTSTPPVPPPTTPAPTPTPDPPPTTAAPAPGPA